MKKLLAIVLLLSIPAFAEFGPIGGGGGGGSGANTALSNLTSPTAINQKLVMGAHDVTFASPNGLSDGTNVTVAAADGALAWGGNNIIDWNNGEIYDSGGNQVSHDFFNRQLKDSGGNVALTYSTNKSVVLNTAAVATNATAGFLYIASCAGAPSGTPAANTGRVPMVYDTTNHKFCIYDSGWKCTAALN